MGGTIRAVAQNNATAGRGWKAELELELVARSGRTVLGTNRHQGPLVVQRPFYPEDDQAAHLYILHPPGGVVAGDGLKIKAIARAGSAALITTPAAGKLYRSDGPRARLEQMLWVEDGAALEWMPLETIVYDGARAQITTRVDLAGSALFLGWEIICLGLPASGKDFEAGQVRQGLEVWRDGRPLLLERGRYQGGSPAMEAAWGLGGRVVCGTMVAVGGDPELVAAARQAAQPGQPPGAFAVTLVSGLIVCRYLGHEAEEARRCFLRAWEVIRPAVMGRAACPPRIWRL